MDDKYINLPIKNIKKNMFFHFYKKTCAQCCRRLTRLSSVVVCCPLYRVYSS